MSSYYRRCLTSSESFIWACQRCCLRDVKIYLEQMMDNKNYHALLDETITDGFIACCAVNSSESIDVRKYIYSIKKGFLSFGSRYCDINAKNNKAFLNMCSVDDIDGIYWLSSLSGHNVTVKNTKLYVKPQNLEIISNAFYIACDSQSLNILQILYESFDGLISGNNNGLISIDLLMKHYKNGKFLTVRWMYTTFKHIRNYIDSNKLELFNVSINLHHLSLVKDIYYTFKPKGIVISNETIKNLVMSGQCDMIKWMISELNIQYIHEILIPDNILQLCKTNHILMLEYICNANILDNIFNLGTGVLEKNNSDVFIVVFIFGILNGNMSIIEKTYPYIVNILNESEYENLIKVLVCISCMFGLYNSIDYLMRDSKCKNIMLQNIDFLNDVCDGMISNSYNYSYDILRNSFPYFKYKENLRSLICLHNGTPPPIAEYEHTKKILSNIQNK